MRVLTGPQNSPEQRGNLAELAGLHGLTPSLTADVQWWNVSTLYRACGWDTCACAVADVAIADAFGIPVLDLIT
jgi:hypothetical protein